MSISVQYIFIQVQYDFIYPYSIHTHVTSGKFYLFQIPLYMSRNNVFDPIFPDIHSKYEHLLFALNPIEQIMYLHWHDL